MGIFKAINTSTSALTAQSFKMDIIAQNIANANTTRTEGGGPYQRKVALLKQQQPKFENVLAEEERGKMITGVEIDVVKADETPFELVYDPEHPDANENGYVEMPNVDLVKEYVDMISASRSYEANITVMNTAKQMAAKALEVGK